MDVQPANLQQLRDPIMSIWTKISGECFQHLVKSMSRRIKAVLKAKVGPTGSICQGWGDWKRAKTQSLEENRLLLTKKQNKRKPPRRGKTSWLASRQGRAGQGWTGHRRHLT